MTSEKLRVAVWGLGAHAVSRILPALTEAQNVEIGGLLSRDVQKAVPIAETLGVPVFSSPEAVLSADEIDVVYVASVTASHIPFGMKVLASGKHLWCEKPLTLDLAALDHLGEVAIAEGTVVFETDMFLHHPQHLELRRILRTGEYGPIRSLNARFGFPHRSKGEFRYDPTLGGGALADAGFYPIAAAIDLLEGPVALQCAVFDRQKGFEVDTDGLVVVTDSAGTPAILEWGFGRAYRNEIEIWTRDAAIHVPRAFAKPPDFVPTISIHQSDGTTTHVGIPATDPFVAMFDSYVDRITPGAIGIAADAYQRGVLISRIASELNRGSYESSRTRSR